MGKRYGRNQKRRDRDLIKKLEDENKSLRMPRTIERPYDFMDSINVITENPAFKDRTTSVRVEVDMKRICIEKHFPIQELYYIRDKPIVQYVEMIAEPMARGIRQELYKAITRIADEVRR